MAFSFPIFPIDHPLQQPRLIFFDFTPYHVMLMLHFHCSRARWPEAHAPAFAGTVRELRDAGILEDSPTGLDWSLSELGAAWLMAMLRAPRPRKAWMDANGQELEL